MTVLGKLIHDGCKIQKVKELHIELATYILGRSKAFLHLLTGHSSCCEQCQV